MAQSEMMERSLTKKLRGSFSTTEIKSFVDLIAKLQMEGLKIDDAFPQGIVSPDAVTIKGHLPGSDILKLGKLIETQKSLREVKLFPRGIPAQDNWRVHMTLEKQ